LVIPPPPFIACWYMHMQNIQRAITTTARFFFALYLVVCSMRCLMSYVYVVQHESYINTDMSLYIFIVRYILYIYCRL
jgi:hypothetical protein